MLKTKLKSNKYFLISFIFLFCISLIVFYFQYLNLMQIYKQGILSSNEVVNIFNKFYISTSIFIFLFFIFMIFLYKSIKKEFNLYKKNIDEINIELFEKNKEMEIKIFVDSHTGLPNGKALHRDIENAEKPRLIFARLDNFSKIIEYYGKEFGDFILLNSAQNLKEFSSKFGLLLYKVDESLFGMLDIDKSSSIEKYEEIISQLAQYASGKNIRYEELGIETEVSSTLGFSLESQDVFKKASIALEYAIEKERNYVGYSASIDNQEEFASQMKCANFIKEAIEEDRIIPFYQGIFDKNEKLIKYECLVRIVEEDGKILSPGFFLDTARKVKYYPQISKIIITKAFEKIIGTDKCVTINLLARDMIDGDVSNFIIHQLVKYKLGKQVILEILEDESIEKEERAFNFIQKVKRIGVKIAVDDFGKGYSNFAYLLKIQPDFVKIDGSLVKDVDKNPNAYAMMAAIIAFARQLNVTVIAEFVWNKSIYDACKKLGVDEFQGYYLSQPSHDFICDLKAKTC